jgi:serine/threonine protein kinase
MRHATVLSSLLVIVWGQGKKNAEVTTTEPATSSKPSQKNYEMIGDYKRVGTLGSGVAGIVYEVEKGGVHFALKRSKDKWDKSIQEEFEVMSKLNAAEGFPKVHALFKCDGRDCLVMDLVGPVVSRLQRQLSRFPPETVGSLGIQLVDRLEAMHKQGIVHGDFYRNNMAIGRGKSSGTIFAIDFGQVGSKRPKKFDVKSVLCTVLGLLAVSENCSHDEDYSRNSKLKIPSVVAELTKYVESLSSDSRIDYDKLRTYMRKLMGKHEYKGQIVWPEELLSVLN